MSIPFVISRDSATRISDYLSNEMKRDNAASEIAEALSQLLEGVITSIVLEEVE